MLNNAVAGEVVRLHRRTPPPPHYYAANLLLMVETVLARYADILTAEERAFGARIQTLDAPAQRLLARLLGRSRALVRADTLAYDEVADARAAAAALEAAGLVERDAPAPMRDLLGLFTLDELRGVFWERADGTVRKAELVARIARGCPLGFARWRLRRCGGWLRVAAPQLALYRLLFFGSRRGDFATFVLRDLGLQRFEPVPLCAASRQFGDRATLDNYLALLAAGDEAAALGNRPRGKAAFVKVSTLIELLWEPHTERLLERRRGRVLLRLGRNLERAGAFDAALTCYRRARQPPARERRMRILRRLGDGEGVEALRAATLRCPRSTLEADFAKRFGKATRHPTVPTVEHRSTGAPTAIEAQALRLLTAAGGTGWHLENDLPLALFGLAYWAWLFAPVAGAFVNPFQTGPVDLFWPDFFRVREDLCEDPLASPLKPRLRAAAAAKAGTANRLFNWQRFTPAVADAVIEAIPEQHLRALVAIVRDDLAGKRSGFPDLTVVYAPGRYEFVEVKGPNDRLQRHQRLWIEALRRRGLPVRVLRLRP